MSSAPHESLSEQVGGQGAGRTSSLNRTVSRVVTLVLAVGFAVVGIAGAASAHHNTITGSVACKTGGGWTVTWTVTNSETVTETITASNRSVVPVGTKLTSTQTAKFTETVTSKPTGDVTLRLDARWDNGNTNTSYGTIPVYKFTDNCVVKTVQPPTVPVVDDCGPGNAHYGQVPTGPWTVTTHSNGSLTVTTTPGHQFPNGQTTLTYPAPTDSNVPCPPTTVQPPTVPVVDDCGPGNAHYGQVPTGPWTATTNSDGSLTLTATPGHQFPNGQTTTTYPVPTDSNVPCPTPPVVTPPVTPPVVTPPEVLPAQVRVVRAQARMIDKCGRSGDRIKVGERSGVVYKSRGKVLRQGAWLKATHRSVTVRAFAADASYRLEGKRVWKMTFSTRPCAAAPEIAPNTGS
ncbi:hypothetical protein HN031_20295 [Nocardioides sp. zg-1308]|uniref:hypothetical protein n=1 Tax=Nocardioides sp. zg-1308 TaxID=2736253 RepID=UPI001551AB5E|nr:hypothetical protein [Nocardioides sp. zg-1308]NPD07022.1 hypothetical protein [Nocardioides sp. zg-1308]